MSDLIEEVPLDSENNEESNINNQEIEEAPAPKRSKGRPAGAKNKPKPKPLLLQK